MSNRIHFEPTVFTNQRTSRVTKGCRIYDDGNATYINTWDSIPDDDIDVIAKCIEDFSQIGYNTPDDFSIILGCVEDEQNGVYVGDEWYDWNEIKHLFAE